MSCSSSSNPSCLSVSLTLSPLSCLNFITIPDTLHKTLLLLCKVIVCANIHMYICILCRAERRRRRQAHWTHTNNHPFSPFLSHTLSFCSFDPTSCSFYLFFFFQEENSTNQVKSVKKTKGLSLMAILNVKEEAPCKVFCSSCGFQLSASVFLHVRPWLDFLFFVLSPVNIIKPFSPWHCHSFCYQQTPPRHIFPYNIFPEKPIYYHHHMHNNKYKSSKVEAKQQENALFFSSFFLQEKKSSRVTSQVSGEDWYGVRALLVSCLVLAINTNSFSK